MASLRRLRRALSAKPVQVTGIALFLLFGLRFVLQNNWDPVDLATFEAPKPTRKVDDSHIDWAKYKYVQYVTTPEYLCSAVMIWSMVEEIGSRANRVMMYPSHWNLEEVDPVDQQPTAIARLLSDAQTKYFVKLVPLDSLSKDIAKTAVWPDSYTKLLAFNQTEYDRILVLDSDSAIRGNLDDLFLIPHAPIAMPYIWMGESEGWRFSSQLMLVQPSTTEFSRIESAISEAHEDGTEMGIIEKLYKGKVMHIAQDPYGLTSNEFRRSEHAQYLRSTSTLWDPEKVLDRAKFLHFSDNPIPKPWIRAPKDLLNKHMPKCRKSLAGFGASDCRDREVWMKLYYDFGMLRKAICGVGFELQSQELPAV